VEFFSWRRAHHFGRAPSNCAYVAIVYIFSRKIFRFHASEVVQTKICRTRGEFCLTFADVTFNIHFRELHWLDGAAKASSMTKKNQVKIPGGI